MEPVVELKPRYQKMLGFLLSLDWKRLTSFHEYTCLMYIQYIVFREMAESLHIARQYFKDSDELQFICHSELKTANLQFLNYQEIEDTYKFLEFFLQNERVLNETAEVVPGMLPEHVIAAAHEFYLMKARNFSEDVRATSAILRKRELHKLYQKMLSNKVLSQRMLPVHLSAFRFFLERKIVLDSENRDALTGFELSQEVDMWFEALFVLYVQAFPHLFTEYEAALHKDK